MIYINGFDNERPEDTVPGSERVVWSVKHGFEKILAVTMRKQKEQIRIYTEYGGIVDVSLPHIAEEGAK